MPFLFFWIFALFLEAHEITPKSLVISGGTTIQPIIEEVAKPYFDATQVGLFVEGGGTEGGLKKLREKRADIAMAARDLTPKEKEEFAYVVIAIDAVAVVFNKNNAIANLTKEQLVDLYSGKTKGFRIISRATDRATLDVFEAYSALVSPRREGVLDAKRITKEAWEAESNINTLLWVSGLQNSVAIVSHAEALRYIAMGYPLLIASIEGVMPTNKTIEEGIYPIRRNLLLVWRKEDAQAAAFVEWSKQQLFRDAIEKLGFVAVKR